MLELLETLGCFAVIVTFITVVIAVYVYLSPDEEVGDVIARGAIICIVILAWALAGYIVKDIHLALSDPAIQTVEEDRDYAKDRDSNNTDSISADGL